MTAIRSKSIPEVAAKCVVEAPTHTMSAPQHVASSLTLASTNERRDVRKDRKGSGCVALAKSRFSEAVSDTVSKLMSQKGFSRERATTLLLNKIRRDGCVPRDAEVLALMRKVGLSLCDAYTAITIAKTLKKARGEHGVSPTAAIDELTSKIKSELFLNDFSKVISPGTSEKSLMKSSASQTNVDTVAKDKRDDTDVPTDESCSSTSSAPMHQKKETKLRSMPITSKPHPALKKGVIANPSRKRAFADEISSNTTLIQSIVTKKPKETIAINLSEKEKIVNPEESVLNTESVKRNRSSGSNNLKRKQRTEMDQPATKRPRV